MSNRDGSGCLKGFLIGCGCLVVIIIVGGTAGFFYLRSHGPKIAAGAVDWMVEAMLEETGISEEEKNAVLTEVKRLTDQIREGTFSPEHMEKFESAFAESDLEALFLLAGMQRNWIEDSTLPESKKEGANIAIQRIQRAIVEDLLSEDPLAVVSEAIPSSSAELVDMGPGDLGAEVTLETKLKDDLSEEEIRVLVDRLNTIADDAGIPNEPYDVDYSGEVRKVIDQILKKDE